MVFIYTEKSYLDTKFCVMLLGCPNCPNQIKNFKEVSKTQTTLLSMLGIQIRNMKMVFNIYGTWRRVTFEKLIMAKKWQFQKSRTLDAFTVNNITVVIPLFLEQFGMLAK